MRPAQQRLGLPSLRVLVAAEGFEPATAGRLPDPGLMSPLGQERVRTCLAESAQATLRPPSTDESPGRLAQAADEGILLACPMVTQGRRSLRISEAFTCEGQAIGDRRRSGCRGRIGVGLTCAHRQEPDVPRRFPGLGANCWRQRHGIAAGPRVGPSNTVRHSRGGLSELRLGLPFPCRPLRLGVESWRCGTADPAPQHRRRGWYRLRDRPRGEDSTGRKG
jgi:hypothetical protein